MAAARPQERPSPAFVADRLAESGPAPFERSPAGHGAGRAPEVPAPRL